jgi:hypothetical protein
MQTNRVSSNSSLFHRRTAGSPCVAALCHVRYVINQYFKSRTVPAINTVALYSRSVCKPLPAVPDTVRIRSHIKGCVYTSVLVLVFFTLLCKYKRAVYFATKKL